MGAGRWVRDVVLALGSGLCIALAIGGVAATLIAVPLRWVQADRDARNDPARCSQSDEFAHTEIHLGGWGQQDTCSYFSATGESIWVPGSTAGPVLRERQSVAYDSVPTVIAALAVVVSGGAIGLAVRRERSLAVSP